MLICEEGYQDITEFKYLIKVCVDGGGGSLKVGLQILRSHDTKQGPPILVALAAAKETPFNINTLLNACNLWQSLEDLKNFLCFDIQIAADSKV